MKLPRPPTSDVIINNRSAFSQPALQSLVHTHEHRSRRRSYTVARQGIHTRTARVVRQASSGPQTHTHTPEGEEREEDVRDLRRHQGPARAQGASERRGEGLAHRARAREGLRGGGCEGMQSRPGRARGTSPHRATRGCTDHLSNVDPRSSPTTSSDPHTPTPALTNPTGGSRDTLGAGIRRGGVRRCAERRDRRASGALGPRRRG